MFWVFWMFIMAGANSMRERFGGGLFLMSFLEANGFAWPRKIFWWGGGKGQHISHLFGPACWYKDFSVHPELRKLTTACSGRPARPVVKYTHPPEASVHAEAGALTELGSVTLKRIGFFCFPIKHSTHCVCFFVLCNRHWFNKAPGPDPRGTELEVTHLPSAFSSDELCCEPLGHLGVV